MVNTVNLLFIRSRKDLNRNYFTGLFLDFETIITSKHQKFIDI